MINLFIACNSVLAFAQKTNFSGTWNLDKTRTDFGEAPEYVLTKTYKVEQLGSKIYLTTIGLTDDLKERSPGTDTLNFNGTVSQRHTISGKLLNTALQWKANDSLVITVERKPDFTNTETWTLEDGGKTLIVEKFIAQGNGVNATIKGYYTKQ